MPSKPSDILRGVIGLVDLSRPSWRHELEAARAYLTCAALPGVPEQSWRPDMRTRLSSESMGISDQIPTLIGAAGIWPAGDEKIMDGLKYIDESVEATRVAKAAGASCAIVPTPVGVSPLVGQTVSALVYRYFRDTQAKTALPLVIHQPKGLDSEYRLTADSVLSLVRMGKIVGLIMEDGTGQEVEEMVRSGRRADFTVICGEAIFPEALDWGCKGVAMDVSSPRLALAAETMRERQAV